RFGAPVWIGSVKLINRLVHLCENVSVNFQNVFGFPTIASANAQNRLLLIDSSDVLIADGGIVEVDYAQSASFVSTTVPDSSPLTTSLVSAYQRNIVLIRVTRLVSWIRGHDTSIVFAVVNY